MQQKTRSILGPLGAILTGLAFYAALAAAGGCLPLHSQELGKYLAVHGYRATQWYDFNSPGLTTPAWGAFDASKLDISTPAGFNERYGAGAAVKMVCGPDFRQGAGTEFRAAGNPSACLQACPCKDGSCTSVCTPRWIPPASAKGYGAGELVSNEAIEAFYRVVGIAGKASSLDLTDAKLVLGAYSGLIVPAVGGGVTAPPAITGDDANAIPISDSQKPCGLFQSTMSGGLRWYRNLSLPPACVGAVPPKPTTPTTPAVPPATTCASWSAQLFKLVTQAPGNCGTLLPPGAVLYRPGLMSTGSLQYVVIP